MSTKLIIMVLGSNVEFTARLPFFIRYNNTTLLFICQYPSKELLKMLVEIQWRSHVHWNRNSPPQFSLGMDSPSTTTF